MKISSLLGLDNEVLTFIMVTVVYYCFLQKTIRCRLVDNATASYEGVSCPAQFSRKLKWRVYIVTVVKRWR